MPMQLEKHSLAAVNCQWQPAIVASEVVTNLGLSWLVMCCVHTNECEECNTTTRTVSKLHLCVHSWWRCDGGKIQNFVSVTFESEDRQAREEKRVVRQQEKTTKGGSSSRRDAAGATEQSRANTAAGISPASWNALCGYVLVRYSYKLIF